MAAAEVAQFQEHPHIIPDPLPSGNYVAKQLRTVYDDSSNLFPASAGSQRSYDKYASLTMKDFFRDFTLVEPEYDDLVRILHSKTILFKVSSVLGNKLKFIYHFLCL